MNSAERLSAQIQGHSVDRLPFTLTLSMYGAGLTDCPLHEYYQNPSHFIAGQQAVAEICKPDVLFSPFCVTAEGQAFGSSIVFLKKSPPNLKSPAIHYAEDIKKIEIPDIDSHPRLTFILESIRGMVKAVDNTKPVAGIVMSPVDLPIMIMGLEKWLDTVLFHKDLAKEMMEKTSRFFVKWANAVLEAGAGFLVIPAMFCNPSILTKDIALKMTFPVLYDIFPEVKGPIFVHHGGASLEKFIDLYNTLPNVAGFVIHSKDRFKDIRSIIGPGKFLLGNIDGPNLWGLTPEKIDGIVKDMLTERRGDGQYILASSSADVALDTPLENIKAIYDAVNAYG